MEVIEGLVALTDGWSSSEVRPRDRRSVSASREIYDLFQGTEQIQQLVVARAISGLRIE